MSALQAVAIVTCRTKPEPDPDEAPLLGALAERGVVAELAAWDDEGVDWSRFAVAVLRSTWNYPQHFSEFERWLARAEAACPVMNPPAIVRWNLHKSYLRDLGARGISVVPTEWVARGAAVDLTMLAASRSWTDVVVKPAIGAASFATRRFGPGELSAGNAFLAENAAVREMMVQPYLPGVEDHGERSIIWIEGRFSHAVRKNPRFGGSHESVSEALAIADDERALAQAVLEPLAADLLYARVDVVRDRRGAPTLMELELCEPSLYLLQNPAALAHFADAIARRAQDAAPFPFVQKTHNC